MKSFTGLYLSVSETAKLCGLSSRTIRRALADGELKFNTVDGRYKIGFSAVLEWVQKNPTLSKKMQSHGLGFYVEKWRELTGKELVQTSILETAEKEPGQINPGPVTAQSIATESKSKIVSPPTAPTIPLF